MNLLSSLLEALARAALRLLSILSREDLNT